MATLTIMRGDETLGGRTLDGPTMVVGRDASCEIQIDDVGTSRRHCEFVRSGATYTVRDLGSANGTFVNGQRVRDATALNDGDEILVGRHTVVYRAAGVAATEAQGMFRAGPSGGAGSAAAEEIVQTLRIDATQLHEQLNALATQTPGRAPQGGHSVALLLIGSALILIAAVAAAIYAIG
jgi:pSer/pThr/pTyr-binding forkhead associated (FHA) protein